MNTIDYNFIAFNERFTNAINIHQQSTMRLPVIKTACQMLNRFDEYLQDEAINNWTEKFNLSKKLLLSFLDGEERPMLNPTEELKEFLLTYDIKQNEITGEIQIIKNKKFHSLQELEMILDAEKYDAKHLKKFLNPQNKNITVVKVYNPLEQIFQKFADQYKGESVISQLAECITATEFEDRKKGEYQKRLVYYLRKWLYKAAGQALNICKNDAMLLWIETKGGSGKSELNKWLFSLPEFQNFYVQMKENKSYLPMDKLSKKLAIDWDELPLSKNRYQTFKSYIAADDVQEYDKATQSYINYKRNVNFIGSTNKGNRDGNGGFLLDDESAIRRRIISIDITGRIDYKKYVNDIDLRQLWGEAAMGILQAQKTNNKNLLTYECDYDELIKYNSKYINANTNADKNIILSEFKAADNETGRLISPMDIIKELAKSGKSTTLTPEKIGHMLKKHNYKRGRMSNYKGYWVTK